MSALCLPVAARNWDSQFAVDGAGYVFDVGHFLVLGVNGRPWPWFD